MSFKRRYREFTRTLRIPWHRWRAFRRLRRYHARPRGLEETVEWGLAFGGGGFFKVQTLQLRPEILALVRAVAALKPRVILEIGTARGGTLLIWSALASRKVISCDLQDMRLQAPLFRAFPPPGSNCEVELLSGDSHSPEFRARVAAALDGKRADFLFIDGDHSEAGVETDYRDYQGFVRPGGLIAFHDIVERQPLPGNRVHPFWRRLKRAVPTEEFVADPNQCGFGIGLVRVPPD